MRQRNWRDIDLPAGRQVGLDAAVSEGDRVYAVRVLGCRLPTERVASLRVGVLDRFMRRQIRPLGYWHPVLSAPRWFSDYDPRTGIYCTYVYADYGVEEA